MPEASGLGSALWRWFFPTCVLGILLPLGLGWLVLAVQGGSYSIGLLFRQGDLFLLTVAVLGSAWGQIGPIGGRYEVLRDSLVAFLAASTGAWAIVRAFSVTGQPVANWVPTWCGAITLALAVAVGIVATVLRDREPA